MADTMSTAMLKGLATKELKQMEKEITVELERRTVAGEPTLSEVDNG